MKTPSLLIGVFLIHLFLTDFLQSQSRTASGTVTTYSLNLQNIGGYHAGSGFAFSVYFSTFDGIANAYPQGLSLGNLSGELSPATAGGTEYRSDYAIYASGYYYNRGTMFLNIPAADSDGNGFPDFLQVNRSIDATIAFTLDEYETNDGGYTFYWHGTEAGTIRLTRSAGNYQGSASGTINTSSFTGNFSAEGGTGNVVYDPSAKTIRFEGTSFGFDTSGIGSSNFTRNNDNQISVAGFYFYTSDGHVRTVYGFNLARSGVLS